MALRVYFGKTLQTCFENGEERSILFKEILVTCRVSCNYEDILGPMLVYSTGTVTYLKILICFKIFHQQKFPAPRAIFLLSISYTRLFFTRMVDFRSSLGYS